MFHYRRLLTTVFVLLTSILLLSLSSSAVRAANCDGLPVTGGILPSGDYTLTADCVLTAYLYIETMSVVSINGNGFALDGNNTNSILYALNGATVYLENITFRNGYGPVSASAIYNDAANIHITNSVFRNNVAGYSGAAVYNEFGVTTIRDSVITDNTIVNRSGHGIIYNEYGTVLINNTTITYNTGGAVRSVIGLTSITNSTITHNTAQISGGGVSVNSNSLTFTNTIISDNPPGNCAGGVIDNGGNLEDTNTCGFANGANTDPMLGAFTGTFYPLLPNSPAINGAPTCAGLTSDQIGTSRPQGSACDIGAIEMPIDPVTGEVLPMQLPAIPSLNEWSAEYQQETRAHAYGMPDNAYGTVHMWNGAWQYNAGGIPQELIDYGVIFAVDVWMYNTGNQPQFDFEGGYEKICLEGEGRLIFLDATQSPRQMTEISPVTFENGYTCGWIPNAGTVVLIYPHDQRDTNR